MICETCHGNGFCSDVAYTQGREYVTHVPCPECGGCGVSHCCDGHQPSDRDKETDK